MKRIKEGRRRRRRRRRGRKRRKRWRNERGVGKGGDETLEGRKKVKRELS